MKSNLQSSRSELKFIVSEELAGEISRFLQTRMEPDPNSKIGCGYDVCSVYMDCPNARLYYQTIQGQKNRYKLRVRVYDSNPANPAFLEIKRREGAVIKKQRAAVDRQSAMAIMSGLPVSDEAVSAFGGSSKDLRALQNFVRLRDSIEAVGSTYVYYKREAYVSPQGTDWRATFDRQLKTDAYRMGEMICVPESCIDTKHVDTVIFELKFTDRFPHWMRDLVRSFNLQDVSFPKYVNCHNSLVHEEMIVAPEGPSDFSSNSGTLI